MVSHPAKHAHLIGIAGVGMSATAILLKESGWTITGSDDGFYPPISDYVAREGILISTPYDPRNIPPHTDLIVIGKSAKLTMANPEVQAAHARGIPIRNFAEVLGEMLRQREPMVVAGSFGKSTATALLSWILIHAGKDPGYMVGALAHDLPRTSYLGTDPTFVIEGDEYPSGHDDPRAKFLHYRAHDLLLTSAVHDHVNIFPTHAAYLAPFRELIASVPPEGLIVACTDDPHVRTLLADARRPFVSYGISTDADWNVRDIRHHERGSTFVLAHGSDAFSIETSMLGLHNIQNIAGASALLIEKGLAEPQEVASAVAEFRGVVRRLDRKTTRSAIPAFEGFGSSYEKAKTAIDALRLHFPARRLIVLFEPHTFSWRNRTMLHWYDTVFADATRVFVYPPPAQGAATHDQSTLEEIVMRIRDTDTAVEPIASLSATTSALKSSLTPDDVVLILTSGHMGGLVQDIPAWLDATYGDESLAFDENR